MEEPFLVVRAQVKEAAKGFSVSSDFAKELNKKVLDIVKTACKRAEMNGRRTVMSKDI